MREQHGMNNFEFPGKTVEATTLYSSNNWKWQTCPSCLLMELMCSNTSRGCCCAVLFLFRTLKWFDVTLRARVLGDKAAPQGHIWGDIMGRAHVIVWEGIGGGSQGNKYSVYLLFPYLFSALLCGLRTAPCFLRCIFLHTSFNGLMACTYWQTFVLWYVGSCSCTACFHSFYVHMVVMHLDQHGNSLH